MIVSQAATLFILSIYISLFKLSTSSSLQCYKGSDSNNLKKVTCDTNVTHCYYTRTLENDTSLKFDQHTRKPVYDRSCDNSNICKTLNKTEENKLVESLLENNQTTQLYCCSTSYCNQPVVAPAPRKCYNALNKGNVSLGLKETCKHDDSHCISISIPSEEGDLIQFYSCEQDIPNITICDGIKTKDSKCQNVTYNGRDSTICCCYGDFCLTPSFNYSESVTLLSLTNDTSFWIDGNLPRPRSNPAYTDWLFNGGLIAAGVLIVLIIVGSFIIVKKCKRKKETNRMTLAYRRIAADSTPDDEEDIRMLLG